MTVCKFCGSQTRASLLDQISGSTVCDGCRERNPGPHRRRVALGRCLCGGSCVKSRLLCLVPLGCDSRQNSFERNSRSSLIPHATEVSSASFRAPIGTPTLSGIFVRSRIITVRHSATHHMPWGRLRSRIFRDIWHGHGRKSIANLRLIGLDGQSGGDDGK